MPARNSIKSYVADGYYHLYNRGVEKRKIFMDEQDKAVFLSYLKEYLLPKDEATLQDKLSNPNTSAREKARTLRKLKLNNFSDEIILLCYCLMPNHFHFFIKQKSPNSIDRFMQSLSTRYIMYFNKKYKRVGSLFQAVYKAVLVQNEEQFVYLSKYIHKQAILMNYPSSYPDFVQKQKTEWVKPAEILNYFSNKTPSLTYKSFIQEEIEYERLQNLLFDDSPDCFSFTR